MEQLILRILKNSFEIDAEIRTKFDEMGGVDILLEMQNSECYSIFQYVEKMLEIFFDCEIDDGQEIVQSLNI